MYSIKYSEQAEIDLEEAISHIVQESITNAMNYLSGYEEKVELLLSNPYMGVECKAKRINRDCRILIYQSHLIIYRVDQEKDELFIIRIYHTSVDYIRKFNQEIK